MAQFRDAPAAQPTLQTVERALNFLECIVESPSPLTIREIATKLELNITTCYHLFNTLQRRNYVERNADSTLRVGFQAAFLYEGYKRGFSSHQAMSQLVDRISRATSETAFLSVKVNDAVVLTALAEGPQAVRASGLYVGLSGLEHVRSSGRAVLAFADEESRERILEKSLSATAPSQRPVLRAKLEQDLALVRERGWAADDQEYEIGICGISAPVFTETGDILGAVGIWAPAARFYDLRESLTAQVVAAAKDATTTLGSAH